jgi:hypothetical protein
MGMRLSKSRFPTDLLLLFLPTSLVLFFVLSTAIWMWLTQVSIQGWRAAFHLAVFAAFVGVLLMVIAKIPQWRAGTLWRFGYHGSSSLHRALYRIAWLFIGTAAMILLILLALAPAVD